MKKVVLGKTKISVSKLCYGTLTLGALQANLSVEEGAELLIYAVEKGINFFDTAQLYETYPYINQLLKYTNKDIVISSKTYAYSKEMAIDAVEQARRELDRDYIDIFMLHEQESIHTLKGHMEALETLYDYKAKGIIKAVGASMHHVAAVVGAIELELDVIHPLINMAGLGIVDGERSDMEKAIEKASLAGMGVFSMKALAGGNLFRRAEECFSYALSNQCIDSIAVGMQSIEEIDGNLEFFETGKFSRDVKLNLQSKVRKLHIDDWCTSCGNCVKRCGQSALSIGEKMAECNSSKCVLCGYCCTVCPMWAIKIV